MIYEAQHTQQKIEQHDLTIGGEHMCSTSGTRRVTVKRHERYGNRVKTLVCVNKYKYTR